MRPVLTVLLVIGMIKGNAQADYPKGYFRNPLDIPMNLSGNFGELRPNHYHMGIDLKTNQRENLSVYAAAEGYISRIKIEPGGFGRAIYITHPNGYTTLYAHLNAFASRIDAYVKQQQYELESWKVQLDVPEHLFRVKKGEFIAFSGNTGGSQAPHLHFEIRRTEDDVNLNPLLFGMPLKDNVKPRILRLGVYDRTMSVYEQSPKVYPVKVAGSSFVTSPGVIDAHSPLISFAVSAFDSHTGSSNLNGIYKATLYVNGYEEESFVMDKISYNHTRYLNAHIDYRYKTLSNSYLQHLSELPGFINSVYTKGDGKGVIDISDGDLYEIRIVITDANGNSSHLRTLIQYDPRKLKVNTPVQGKVFYPLMIDGFEVEGCEFFIGEKCLYDSVHVNYSNHASGNPDVISDIHVVGAPYIPLQDSFLVRITPDASFMEEDRHRTVMQWHSGPRTTVQKVQWQYDWASARFRDFGSFQLVRDTLPPVINISFADGANLSKSSRIIFSVKDNLPVVKNVRAELDGKWLRFTNDKGRSFIYQFDEKCLSGPHVLQVSAEDEAGNRTVSLYKFTR